MIKYVVFVGYKEFNFYDRVEAMEFASSCLVHSTDPDLTIRIELVYDIETPKTEE